ncbi:MAG: hypothetical protein HYR96_11375 [Deltaproteobacteria bacterium]|nr:hypothetical protein [Deltaproteobacteria bacterium]MBI3293269.1 hypothetical protein [Deltaproteobacteria bacterium]
MRFVTRLLALQSLLFLPTLLGADSFTICVAELNRAGTVATAPNLTPPEYSLRVPKAADEVCPRTNPDRRMLLVRFIQALFPRGARVRVSWGGQNYLVP